MKQKSLPDTMRVCGIAERAMYKATYETLRPAYENTLQSLVSEIRRLLEGSGYTPTIKYRLKRFDAYFDKLLRQSRQLEEGNGNGNGPELTDLLGIRIICPFLADLETIERLLARQFTVVELEWKGARHSFREFGYDSVHLLIRLEPAQLEEVLPHSARVCEIQLRTILQDAWAEVEHELIYKSDISLPNDSIKRKLASLNATLTLSDLIFQEIRDYQSDIRERDRKRRQSLDDSFGQGPADCLRPGTPSGEAPPELVALTGQRKLEKLMLDALDAHSRSELERAIELYGQILRLKLADPVRALVYNHRGMAHFGQSDYTQAIRDFSRAIFFNGSNVRCYNNRGLAFRVIKALDKSLADYDRSLALNPSQVEGYWGRAQTCYDMQLYSQALADCESALNIQPDFQPAHSLIARINSQVF
ncbi:(p)ppGpp synthetase [Trichloromonas sp.]|uniref:(p)ppGpp synthetase n=1 Tax=Trichloromonas sp. TaxID=3069249 RepID=UPI003D819361